MNPKTEDLIWQGEAGAIEVSVNRPDVELKGLSVIAHPHPLFGGTKDNKVTQTIARAMLQLGYLCVRFNFRGVGASAGVHDHGQGEARDMIAVVNRAHAELLPEHLQSAPVALGGFSFGAFVTSHAADALKQSGLNVGKLVLVGTATSRFKVANVPADSLIVHGEVDDTVPLQTVFDWARPQGLPIIVMPGVEHFFHGRLPQLKDTIVRLYPC